LARKALLASTACKALLALMEPQAPRVQLALPVQILLFLAPRVHQAQLFLQLRS
jgi:hypothetical protein